MYACDLTCEWLAIMIHQCNNEKILCIYKVLKRKKYLELGKITNEYLPYSLFSINLYYFNELHVCDYSYFRLNKCRSDCHKYCKLCNSI